MKRKRGWTGGQYSVYRALLALGSFIACLASLGRVSGFDSTLGGFLFFVLLAAGLLSAVLLGLGWQDKPATFVLLAVFAVVTVLDFLPWVRPPFLILALLLHLFTRPSPYGSLSARNRPDPNGNWTFDSRLYGTASFFIVIYALYHAIISLQLTPEEVENPLGIPMWLHGTLLTIILVGQLFTAVVVYRIFAAVAWFLILLTGVLLAMVEGTMALNLGFIFLLMFLFDPSWVRPRRQPGKGRPLPEVAFYDGNCGLCHRFVRFLIAEDRGMTFRVAPLQGETFARMIPRSRYDDFPETFVVVRRDGRILTRSAAALYVGARLGGMWRILAAVAHIVPRRGRDRIYDFIASIRHRLFSRPATACPILPGPLRERVLE